MSWADLSNRVRLVVPTSNNLELVKCSLNSRAIIDIKFKIIELHFEIALLPEFRGEH